MRKIVTIEISTIEKIDEAAHEFILNMESNKIFLFNGNMGAGKTTFIKSICKKMGVKETINSPTFSIVNEYETNNNKVIFHFDCYRINKIEEAIEMGIEDYLYSGNLCFIEWAENIAPLLPSDCINVDIKETENGIRIIELQK